MQDLFPFTVSADAIQSPAIRLSPVIGDSMEPTLRGGLDYVACVPVDSYVGEGLYLLGGLGSPQVYRVDADLSDGLRLMCDNERYKATSVSLRYFEEVVLAKVVADVKVRDPRRLHEAAGR